MSKAIAVPAEAGFHTVQLTQTVKHLFGRVATIAGARPADLLLSGGAVRDLMMGREPADYDFFVSPARAKHDPAKVRKLYKEKLDLTQISILDRPRECSSKVRLCVNGTNVDLRYSRTTAQDLNRSAGYALGSAVLSEDCLLVSQDFLDDLRAHRLTIRSGLDEATRASTINKVRLLSQGRLKAFAVKLA